MNFDEALREWGYKKLQEAKLKPCRTWGIEVEYYNDGWEGSEDTGPVSNYGIEISGWDANGRRIATFVNTSFTILVQEIADVYDTLPRET